MEDSIKVAVRTRPLNKREKAKACVSIIANDQNQVMVQSKPEAKSFTFDYVADEESSQESIFQNIGAPLTESCLEGFNGTDCSLTWLKTKHLRFT